MKKLSWLLVLALLISAVPFAAMAEGDYSQSPLFDERVESGELPPVEERLPEVPKLVDEISPEYLDYECGNYGGTLRLVTQVVNWDADGFVGQNEALMTMESVNSGVVTPNIVEEVETNDDNTEFVFKLRKGLKWSDGSEVTIEDFRFGIENYVFNEELTPVVAAYMRDGGTSLGEPFKFEVIDDEHFKITFNSSYGGFLVHTAIAGWKGYSDLLKPAAYLKPFHKDFAEECHGSLEAYYEFIRPFAEKMGYEDPAEEGIWCYVFNQIDMTNWELTDPNDALTSEYFPGLIDKNFPHLYPYIMISFDGGITTWERNPYYHKVDEDGQQLPYIDYITSTLVENMEMVQMEYMSGKADFGRESATIDNISLYRENEESANITAYVTPQHVNPTSLYINVTYGLNTDGTVKDDDASKAWQEVATDLRFRKALMMAIDAEEIIDSVYKGFAGTNPAFPCEHDIEGAKALLDEMGMVDIDGDGYRETPSGLPFQWQIWNANEASDIIPTSELYVEFWSEIGLKAQVYTTDSTLLSKSQEANEIPMRVIWFHSSALWHNPDFGEGNMRLWQIWVDKGGLSGAELDPAQYLEPPQEYKDVKILIQSLLTVSPEDAVNKVVPEILKIEGENLWVIEPLTNVQQCVIINSDIGNVPTGGVGISWNFGMEQLFYRSFEY